MATERGDRLRVAIDVCAIPQKLTGAGRYTLEVVRALDALDEAQLVLVARRNDGSRWRDVAPHAKAVLATAPDQRLMRLAYGELLLGVAMRHESPDVVFGPHYTMPRASNAPCVVSVHDLTMIEHPQWHERSKVAYFSRALRRAARRAAGLVFVSDHARQRFLVHYETAAETFVVAHGIDHEVFCASEPIGGFDEEVLRRLSVRAPYVLAVGTIEPRKNHVSLVRAMRLLWKRHDDLSLVIAGGEGWGSRALEQELSDPVVSARVRRLGHVDDHELAALYRAAAVCAYPSFEEGFGLPALESLACKVALVTTANSAMSEFSGDVAFSVEDVTDDHELASAIESALGASQERLEKGVELAAAYTWQSSATEHLAAFRRVVAQ